MQALDDTLVATEQWCLWVPPDEQRLRGPFTSIRAVGAAEGDTEDEYLGCKSARLRVWRIMHFLKDGHNFSGTMQSIVAAAALQLSDAEEDIFAERLTNCVDVVELRYTRCLMMSVALLRALGMDPGATATLNLGCGAGTIPMLLKTKYPGMTCDVVEIEPAVIEVARKWMGYEDTALGIHTHIRDAKEYLINCTDKYHIVFVDAYENSEVPEHLGGTEERLYAYVGLIKKRLREGGVVASDLIYYSEEEFEKGLKVWVDLFGDQYVHVIAAGENQSVVLAVQGEDSGRREVGANELRDAAAAMYRDGGYLFDLSALIPAAYRRVPADPAAACTDGKPAADT